VLSRIAEHVYWVGRLVERAEGVSRLVAAYHYSATQLGALEDHAGLQDIIAGLGEPGGRSRTFRAAAMWWVTADENPFSVASCVRGAREHARRAREVLSLEVWEAVNAASAWVDSMARDSGYVTVVERVPDFTRAIAGVVETTVPRDETWAVLRLGTMVERAPITLRAILIGAQAADRLEASDPLALHAWTVTLRACSALDAYRKTSLGGVPRAEEVVELLLRSPTCPRSVLYAVREAQALVPFGGEAAHALEQVRGRLEARRYRGRVSTVADRLLAECDGVHEAVVGEWRGRWETA
jgi:uncharacterized alpha-E superfamily protein